MHFLLLHHTNDGIPTTNRYSSTESATEWYGSTHARTRFFVLIAALAVDEDKRAQRHAAPIALVEGQDCAVVIGVLAPDIFQEKQKPNAF